MSRAIVAISFFIAGFLVSCGDSFTSQDSALSQPADFVISGPGLANGEPEYLFIANASGNYVTALDMQAGIEQLDYAVGPVQYFPIMIPVGQAPKAIETTADGSLLVVASSVDNGLFFIDTSSLKTVTISQDSEIALRIPISADQAGIIELAHRGSCGMNCDSFFALDAQGVLLEFDLLRKFNEQLEMEDVSLMLHKAYDAGPSPANMVYDQNTDYIWISQKRSARLVGIDLQTGLRTEYDVPGPQNDLLLTADAQYLLLALNQSNEVAVYANPYTAFERIDNNARYLALDAADDEQDVYVGSQPYQMLFASAEQGDPSLTVYCGVDDGGTETYDDYVVTATLGGSIRFLVPKTEKAGFELVDLAYCANPSIEMGDEDSASDNDWLSPCAASSRRHCEHGVTVFPGYTPTVRWELSYQGNLLGKNNYIWAQTEEDGILIVDDEEVSLDGLHAADVNSGGDLVQILSETISAKEECVTRYGSAEEPEKRRFAIQTTSDNRISLVQDVDWSCFGSVNASVKISIHTNEQFVLSAMDSDEEVHTVYGRVEPGQRVGQGGDTLRDLSIAFQVNQDSCQASCAFGQRIVFDTKALASPLKAPEYGRLPATMQYVSMQGVDQKVLMVLFEANNLLLGFTDMKSSTLNNDAYFFTFN